MALAIGFGLLAAAALIIKRLTTADLSGLSDASLSYEMTCVEMAGGDSTPYIEESNRRIKKAAALAAMSDVQLINKINYDAEDGRINTAYSEEYDRRRAQRNKEKK